MTAPAPTCSICGLGAFYLYLVDHPPLAWRVRCLAHRPVTDFPAIPLTSTIGKVVMLSIILTDPQHREAMNAPFDEHLTGPHRP